MDHAHFLGAAFPETSVGFGVRGKCGVRGEKHGELRQGKLMRAHVEPCEQKLQRGMCRASKWWEEGYDAFMVARFVHCSGESQGFSLSAYSVSPARKARRR